MVRWFMERGGTPNSVGRWSMVSNIPGAEVRLGRGRGREGKGREGEAVMRLYQRATFLRNNRTIFSFSFLEGRDGVG